MANNARGVLRGLRVVAEALRSEDFPATKSDLDYSVGDVEVEDGHGNYVPVRDALDHVEQEDFRTAEEAIRAIHAAASKVKVAV